MKILFTDPWGKKNTIDLADRELWVIGSFDKAHLKLERDSKRWHSRIQCFIRKENLDWHICDGCPETPVSWAEEVKLPPPEVVACFISPERYHGL